MPPDAVSSHPGECFPGQALGLNKTPRAGELTGGAPSLWTESVFQKGFQMSSLTSFLDSVVWQHLEYRRQLAWGLGRLELISHSSGRGPRKKTSFMPLLSQTPSPSLFLFSE